MGFKINLIIPKMKVVQLEFHKMIKNVFNNKHYCLILQSNGILIKYLLFYIKLLLLMIILF